MTAQTWLLEGPRATLQAGPLAAALDLARPALGLTAVRYHGQPLALSLLALEAPAIARLDATSLVEGYVQGDNLVAAYRESPAWPVRVDSHWRAGVEGPLAVLDLVVSVRTPLLDSRPELMVQSTVKADGVWRLVSLDCSRFEPCSSVSALQGTAGGVPGCLLFRLPGDTWSCAAMVHPADFTRIDLVAGEREPGVFRLAYDLFSGRLEKGVILRARLRCVLLPRDGDLSLTAAHYGSWIAAEPPLGP